MGNRILTSSELQQLFRPLFEDVVKRLSTLSNGDEELLFALRRKLFKELTYLERDKPAVRVKLKARKRNTQKGLCTECGHALPEFGAVLDRLRAIDGYTDVNTRLICPECDKKIQTERRFA